MTISPTVQQSYNCNAVTAAGEGTLTTTTGLCSDFNSETRSCSDPILESSSGFEMGELLGFSSPSKNSESVEWILPTSSALNDEYDKKAEDSGRLRGRIKFLKGRIRKLRLKQTISHGENQLRHFFNMVEKLKNVEEIQSLLNDKDIIKKIHMLLASGKLSKCSFITDEFRHLNSENLVKVLRHVGALGRKLPPELANQQHSSLILKKLISKKTAEGDAQDWVSQIKRLVCHCNTLLNEDSDATDTDTSDSDEEADVSEKYPAESKAVGFEKRRWLNARYGSAVSNWLQSRANLGSRWNWLKSQITDLDLKIQHQVEVCCLLKDLRNSAVVKEVPDTVEEPETLDEEEASSSTCSRWYPAKANYRRRVIRTSQILSCILCSGRRRGNEPYWNAESNCKSITERYGLLDHTYHEVLNSRAAGVHQQLKIIEAICGDANSFRRHFSDESVPHVTVLSQPLKQRHVELKEFLSEQNLKDLSAQNLCTSLQTLNETHTEVSAKDLINKHHNISLSRTGSDSPVTWSEASSPLQGSDASGVFADLIQLESIGTSSKSDCNLLLPCCSKSSTRKSVSSTPSYDIDNIIIDPRVAAVSRVEKLQYKEIITPGWRHSVSLSNSFSNTNDDHLQRCVKEEVVEKVEDIRDESYENRHSKHEAEERRKFEDYKLWAAANSAIQKGRNSYYWCSSPVLFAYQSGKPQILTNHVNSNSSVLADTNASTDFKETEQTITKYVAEQMTPYPTREFPLSESNYLTLLSELKIEMEIGQD